MGEEQKTSREELYERYERAFKWRKRENLFKAFGGVAVYFTVMVTYLLIAGTEKTLDALLAGIIALIAWQILMKYYCRKKRREIMSDEEMQEVLNMYKQERAELFGKK